MRIYKVHLQVLSKVLLQFQFDHFKPLMVKYAAQCGVTFVL